MRIPLFVAVLLLLPITGGEFGAPSIAQDHDGSVEGMGWRTELNTKVAERNHWRWTLRRVERSGDRLVVSLRYRNNATTGRPMILEDQYLETIFLLDESTDTRFALLQVEGVSEAVTAVDRRKSKVATFTFTYPEGASTVRFTSRWISMRMGGEASVMEVDFPIELPPSGAGPN